MSEASRGGTPAQSKLESDVQRLLDDALETLRRCRAGIQGRGASESLRELETKLGYVAQALSWQMDGEALRANAALRLAQGLARRERVEFFDPHDPRSLFWDRLDDH